MRIFISFTKPETMDLATSLMQTLDDMPDITVQIADDTINSMQLSSDINDCDVIVVLLSPACFPQLTSENESTPLQQVINHAQDLNKVIIPVIAMPIEQIPASLAALPKFDLTTDLVKGVNQLSDHITTLLIDEEYELAQLEQQLAFTYQEIERLKGSYNAPDAQSLMMSILGSNDQLPSPVVLNDNDNPFTNFQENNLETIDENANVVLNLINVLIKQVNAMKDQ